MHGQRHVIGVIDDDASVRSALLRLFRTAALDVSLFASAEEYLASPDRVAVDCLVIDVCLPGLGGLGLLERVQAESARPCLVITGQEDRQVQDRALAQGAIGFFLKPFDNHALRTVVLRALGLARS